MTDGLFQQVGGGMRMPSRAADVDATALTLTSLDPARDTLLALFAAAINSELTPAWAVVSAVVPTLAGKSPVADTWPGPPTTPLMLQRAADFPILFLSRDGDAIHEDFSLVRKQIRQTWELHYALAPLTIGDERKIRDVLTYVDAVIMATIERKGHPAYQDGAPVLFTAGFATLNITRSRKGQAKFVEGNNAPTYWMLTAELESTEIQRPLTGAQADWLGTKFAFSTGNADGLISPFLQADSEQYKPPLQPWAEPQAADGATLTTGGDTLVTPGGDTLLNA